MTNSDEPNNQSYDSKDTPRSTEIISIHLWQDPDLAAKFDEDLYYLVKMVNDVKLIYDKNNLMPVPKPLRLPLIEWYHTNLCHPGTDRTERTIKRNFS